MAGQIRKEDIIQQQEIQQAFNDINKSAENLLNTLKQIAQTGVLNSETLKGLSQFKDVIKQTKQATKTT